MALKNKPKVLILGIGGAGCNLIRGLGDFKETNIELWAIGTDILALERSQAPYKLLFANMLLNQESFYPIRPALQSSKVVFLIAGLGGRTGSSLTPILAHMARAAGAKTVGIVFFPFLHEGPNRKALAQASIHRLKDTVDILKIVPNELINRTEYSVLDLNSAFAVIDRLVGEEIRSRI